jgi:general stress protein 26
MQKTISQIRDIEVIEKELIDNPIGVLAMSLKDEKISQQAITFLYQDKNIYFFFKENDEEFEDIKLESSVCFTIVKNDKVKKSVKEDFISEYNILSITITGLIKVVDDPKLAGSLVENYISKYSKVVDKEGKPGLTKVVFIDTEEIQAYEEMGG